MNNFAIFFKLLAAGIAGLAPNSHFNIKQASLNPTFQTAFKFQKFEDSFVYPFSDNEDFTIRHGAGGDYFAFFKSLGQPYYYVVKSKQNRTVKKKIDGKKVVVEQRAGEIAAVACGVLRTVPNICGEPIKAWYICDLKVNEKYQGEHIPIAIIKKVALSRFVQCPRGFAICMNPAVGDPKAASIFKKHGPIEGITTHTLNLYTLTAEQAHEHRDYLQTCLINHGYMKQNEKLGLTSTHGAKNYLITNKTTLETRSWNLLHMDPYASNFNPQEGATHMICAIDGSDLDNDFKKVLGEPSSTAQVLSHGMEDVDFNFLTSNQI